jgi:hypothetical protein
VGFQLVVFGIAAGLYGVQRGAKPNSWLLTLGRREVRLTLILAGTGSTGVGAMTLLILLGGWLRGGAGAFRATGTLSIAGAMLTWGVEAALAALFVSIFARDLATNDERVTERPRAASHAPHVLLERES